MCGGWKQESVQKRYPETRKTRISTRANVYSSKQIPGVETTGKQMGQVGVNTNETPRECDWNHPLSQMKISVICPFARIVTDLLFSYTVYTFIDLSPNQWMNRNHPAMFRYGLGTLGRWVGGRISPGVTNGLFTLLYGWPAVTNSRFNQSNPTNHN